MEQFSAPSPSCCPPGSCGDAGRAAEPGSGESQGNTEMEVSREDGKPQPVCVICSLYGSKMCHVWIVFTGDM